jgi:hypothetical protein
MRPAAVIIPRGVDLHFDPPWPPPRGGDGARWHSTIRALFSFRAPQRWKGQLVAAPSPLESRPLARRVRVVFGDAQTEDYRGILPA